MNKGSGTSIQRFWRRVEKSDTCWLWIGRIDNKGYGRTDLMGEHNGFAHIFAYKVLVGPITDGVELDHTCHTEALLVGRCRGGNSCPHRRCVNPSHLELVTHRINVLRGNSLSAQRARQTHCIRNHELAGDNVKFDRFGRHCKACHKESTAQYAITHKTELREYQRRRWLAKKAATA